MREDLKHIIFDTQHRKKSNSGPFNTKTRGKERVSKDDEGEYKDPPPTETRRSRRLGWEYRSNWAVNWIIIKKLLKANVGKPYDEVYSQFCKIADARAFAGKELRQQWNSLFDKKGWSLIFEYYKPDFYVDENGLIQKSPKEKYKYSKPKPTKYFYKRENNTDYYFVLLEESNPPSKCGCFVFNRTTEDKSLFSQSNYKFVCCHGNAEPKIKRWYVVSYHKVVVPGFGCANKDYFETEDEYLKWYRDRENFNRFRTPYLSRQSNKYSVINTKKTPNKKELKVLQKLINGEE